MSRVVCAGGLLVAIAALAAGCGGASTEQAAIKYARGFGGKDPHVIRVERVRTLTGAVVDIVLMRTRFCFNGSPISTAASTAPACRETWAQIQLAPGGHKLAGGATFGAPPETRAIDEARKANPVLRVFPDINRLRVRCQVPRALVPGGVAGVCYSDAGPRGASFVVGWPLSRPSGTRHHGGWLVRLSPTGTVLGITIHRHGPVDTWSVAYRDSLRRLAYRDARELGDPHPRRVRLQIAVPSYPPFNSPVDVIELWGDFACSPSKGCHFVLDCGGPRTGSCTIRGHYARIEIDWSSRQPRGFELLSKPPRN